MFVKRFFYVCAGIFLLALSYHLGARSATATGFDIEGAGFDQGEYASFTLNRVFHAFSRDPYSNGDWIPYEFPAPAQPVPGTAPVVATMVGLQHFFVLLANGDAYDAEISGPTEPTWAYRGNLTGKPTSTREGTWGSVKARYR